MSFRQRLFFSISTTAKSKHPLNGAADVHVPDRPCVRSVLLVLPISLSTLGPAVEAEAGARALAFAIALFFRLWFVPITFPLLLFLFLLLQFLSSSLLCSGSFFHFVNSFASTRINHSAICVIFFLPFYISRFSSLYSRLPFTCIVITADLICYSFDMNVPPFILFISIRGGGWLLRIKRPFLLSFYFIFSPSLILLCSFLRPFFICSIGSVSFLVLNCLLFFSFLSPEAEQIGR